MQINLLSERIKVPSDFNRIISRARSKKCITTVSDEYLSAYKSFLERHPCADARLRYHVETVLQSFDMSLRKYSYFEPNNSLEHCIIFNDSHNEIEKLGAQIYFKGKCIVLSMDNFLDVALQKCCGAEPLRVRRLRDYDVISFLFMNCALHRANEIIYLERFRGVDKNLDSYLQKCSQTSLCKAHGDDDESSMDEEETVNTKIVRKVYYGVLQAATSILLNCVIVLCDKFNLAIRSQGFSNFVLSPKNPDAEFPEFIDYTDADVSFRLPVLSLKRWEYLDILQG